MWPISYVTRAIAHSESGGSGGMMGGGEAVPARVASALAEVNGVDLEQHLNCEQASEGIRSASGSA